MLTLNVAWGFLVYGQLFKLIYFNTASHEYDLHLSLIYFIIKWTKYGIQSHR